MVLEQVTKQDEIQSLEMDVGGAAEDRQTLASKREVRRGMRSAHMGSMHGSAAKLAEMIMRRKLQRLSPTVANAEEHTT